MMRSCLRAVFCWLALTMPCFAAGSIPIALQQSVDVNGRPLALCNLYVYQVGTVATPQNIFQDFGLTATLPNPLQCDVSGRLPMFYLADGSVHVRLTDSAGLVVFDYPSMQVLGPSSGGGGGGGTIDPTTIASTGDVKFRPTSEVLTGWVKINGLTIGSATSGATGRANSDTQALFVYLWGVCTDAHCPVLTGRGVSGLADFSANKQLTLPDWRATIPVGLDDMGNVAAGRLLASNITSGGGDGVTTPMAGGGEANHTVTQSELPNVNLTTSGSNLIVAAGQGSHTHSYTAPSGSNSAPVGGSPTVSGTTSSTTGASTLPQMTVSGTIPLGGSGAAGNNLPPFRLGSWHMKL
jgi:hypothetical protein